MLKQTNSDGAVQKVIFGERSNGKANFEQEMKTHSFRNVLQPKPKFYSLNRINGYGALYNVIFGERSNGKTYAVLEQAIEDHAKTGAQLAIVRRWNDDFVGKRGATMFDGPVANGVVTRATKGEWTGIYYYGSRWWFCKYDKDGHRVVSETPFAFGFALNSMEHDKSTSYPGVHTVLFDEFISKGYYIPDEFVLFMNVLSTIIRNRSDVRVYMLGNTVNKYCPYFSEMGLKHIKRMKPGTIDLYHYGQTELTVAVEYVEPTKDGKPSDVYFAFDNPKLTMITGGAWELDMYPHLPRKYKPKDVAFEYFVQFDGEMLHADVVFVDDITFTFVHRKTTPIKDPDRDLVFTTDYNPRPNYRRNILRPTDRVSEKIAAYYKEGRVYYQDNETGELVGNYLKWCRTNV